MKLSSATEKAADTWGWLISDLSLLEDLEVWPDNGKGMSENLWFLYNRLVEWIVPYPYNEMLCMMLEKKIDMKTVHNILLGEEASYNTLHRIWLQFG